MGRISKSLPLALAFAALATSAMAATADPTKAINSFVVHLYAGYKDPAFNPRLHPAGYFDPAMTTRLTAVRAIETRTGEAILDWDPVCKCQDPDGLRARVLDVRLAGPSSATAHVDLFFGPSSSHDRLALSLSRVNGEWRIHDIATSATPSLAALLDTQIQSHRARRR